MSEVATLLGDTCEECETPFVEGDSITYTPDGRCWHVECFGNILTPLEQWPKPGKE